MDKDSYIYLSPQELCLPTEFPGIDTVQTGDSELVATSPIDWRYGKSTRELASYSSEAALIRGRVAVEIEYFIALTAILSQLKWLYPLKTNTLRDIYVNFTLDDARAVKEIEKTTNHDVKAVEYFLQNKFRERDIPEKHRNLIHFALTSYDTNGIANPLLFKGAIEQTYIPEYKKLLDQLKAFAEQYKDTPMLAHTHWQPASPTRLGKEIEVFINRLEEQYQQLLNIPHSAKFGGATGNFNAHYVAYPDIKWGQFADEFTANFWLKRTKPTTQIEPYDNFAAQCDALSRINTILIGFCRDMRTYISMEYFKQKIKKGEVGSSTMPHKINPIDFENAEGNLGMANALLEHFKNKLPISRLQRDLSDSTVFRNAEVPLAYTLIALKAIQRGFNKLLVNEEKINQDLEDNWEVVAEAIQTILRRVWYSRPYETLKNLTRTGGKITRQDIINFIDGLDGYFITSELTEELKAITPHNFTGMREE